MFLLLVLACLFIFFKGACEAPSLLSKRNAKRPKRWKIQHQRLIRRDVAVVLLLTHGGSNGGVVISAVGGLLWSFLAHQERTRRHSCCA
jgi:hypothetical protein